MTKKVRRGVAKFVTTMANEAKMAWLKIFRHNIRTAPKVDGSQLFTIPCTDEGMEWLSKLGLYLNPKWKVRARGRGRRAGKGMKNYYYTGRHEYGSHLPQELADWFAVYLTNGITDKDADELVARRVKWETREIVDLKAVRDEAHTKGYATAQSDIISLIHNILRIPRKIGE